MRRFDWQCAVMFKLVLLSICMTATPLFADSFADSFADPELGRTAAADSTRERMERLQLPADRELSLLASERIEWLLDLDPGDFLRGNLLAEQPFDAAITDANGAVVRHLVRPGDSAGRVFFVAAGAGPFRLRIHAPERIPALNLAIESVPLKNASIAAVEPDSMPSVRIREARQALRSGESVDRIWAELAVKGTPLIEYPSNLLEADIASDERLVTFLWRGAREGVRLFGGPGHSHDPLYRLADTDIWYRSYTLPSDTRMSYQLAPDVPQIEGSSREQRVAILATAQQDPFNPQAWSPDGLDDVFNIRSVLELEHAPSDALAQRDVAFPAAQGHRFEDAILGNSRSLDIWMPEGMRDGAEGPVPLAIFFDGLAYQQRIPTPRILQALILDGRLPPLVAVFVGSPDLQTRARELPCNPVFAEFMAERLLPFVRQQTGLSFTAEHTMLAGASYGGLAAACTALQYPDLFGAVLSQSGSFWWSPQGDETPDWFASRLSNGTAEPVRFYLSAGRFENGSRGGKGILETNRHLQQVLRRQGYSVHYEEFTAGHDYLHWRATLGEALAHMLAE